MSRYNYENRENSMKLQQNRRQGREEEKRRRVSGNRQNIMEYGSCRKMWEEHQRQSAENVSHANGWMHVGYSGIGDIAQIFCPDILH